MANWPTGGCNVDKFFEPQSLIFDITLCGDFGTTFFFTSCNNFWYLIPSIAGTPAVFNETCSGVCYNELVTIITFFFSIVLSDRPHTLLSFVIGSPSNYDNAYFEVDYVRVYGNSNSVKTSSAQGLFTSQGRWTLLAAALVAVLGITLWSPRRKLLDIIRIRLWTDGLFLFKFGVLHTYNEYTHWLLQY